MPRAPGWLLSPKFEEPVSVQYPASLAQQLVEAHGEGAEYQAGVRGAAFLREGNNAGFYLWQDIATKVRDLQKTVTVGKTINRLPMPSPFAIANAMR